MRKQFAGIAALVLVIALGAVTASAQVDITLGVPGSPATSSGTVTFTGTGGGNESITFGGCPAAASGDCWSGNTTGFAGPHNVVGDFWEINFAGVGVTMNPSGTITQTGPAAFTLGTSFGDGSLLTGTLQLVNLGQIGGTGNFNYDLTANLTVTGGSLASFFYNGTGVTTITILLAPGQSIIGLAGGTSVTGNNPVGTLTSTPEPSSVLLLGSGLLMFGGVLRRKLVA
jgi:hypothetical protein